jgi:outer membrane lipoprotein SlyB
MSDPTQPFPGEPKSPFQPGAAAPSGKRNALLAAAGLGLCAIGVAAGMAFKSAPADTPVAATPAASMMVSPTALAPQGGTAANTAPAPVAAAPQALAAPVTPVPAAVQQQAPATYAQQQQQQQQQQPVAYSQQPPAPVQTSTGNGVPNYGTGQAPVRVAQAPQAAPRPTVCATCGVVEDVTAVRQKGEGTGLGAVAGGALGGILGHQVGGGNGRTALTVLGAVGGGFAGHEVEQRARATTSYDVRVRMDNGAIRHFTRQSPPPVGERVTVDSRGMRIASR